MKTSAELTETFRRSGRKVTPQRQCIFRILEGNEAHPTAESVYEKARAEMETISLKTVYQILYELADMGEIQTLDLGTGSSRFDPNVSAHHHLVCTSCGQVRDLAEWVDLPVPPASLTQGFRVGRAEITLRGLCADCGPKA